MGWASAIAWQQQLAALHPGCGAEWKGRVETRSGGGAGLAGLASLSGRAYLCGPYPSIDQRGGVLLPGW